MTIDSIYQRLKRLESDDIFLLCSNRNIGIVPEEIEEYEDGSQALIIGNGKHTTIHIACLNKSFATLTYILKHEFGHFITDPDENYHRNYLMSNMREQHERDANIFAVLSAIPRKPESDQDFLTVARSKGVPPDIAIMVRYLLSLEEDPFFKTYYDAYK